MSRLYKSTIAVALLTALLLVLFAVPGRIVFRGTPFPSWTFDEKYAHGWPWVYLQRQVSVPVDPTWKVIPPLPHGGIPWLRGSNWRFWQAGVDGDNRRIRTFHIAILALDAMVACLVIVLVSGLWEIRRRRRPRVWSFRLADLLTATALVSIALGWLGYQKLDFERERRLVDTANIDEWHPIGDIVNTAPKWIDSLCGDKYRPAFFSRQSAVKIYADKVNDAEAVASQISQLKCASLIEVVTSSNPDDLHVHFDYSTLRYIEQLRELDLSLFDPTIDLQDVNRLAQLTQLETLKVWEMDELPLGLLNHLKSSLPDCRVIDIDSDHRYR